MHHITLENELVNEALAVNMQYWMALLWELKEGAMDRWQMTMWSCWQIVWMMNRTIWGTRLPLTITTYTITIILLHTSPLQCARESIALSCLCWRGGWDWMVHILIFCCPSLAEILFSVKKWGSCLVSPLYHIAQCYCCHGKKFFFLFGFLNHRQAQRGSIRPPTKQTWELKQIHHFYMRIGIFSLYKCAL